MNADKPIKRQHEDRLNRVEFAGQLAKTLLSLHKGEFEETFTVGLYGKWGCGKTSIVNLTLSEIERIENKEKIPEARKLIHLDFEPWNFSDTNQLMQQFFVQLASKFEKSSEAAKKTVGKYLRDYAGAFSLLKAVPYVGEVLAVLGQAAAADFAERLSAAPNLSQQKDDLIKALQGLDTSILVVMDDLDRLSSEQIRCVFQLVTSVANFPNITYLLVFDKDVVVKALEAVQKGRGEDYLEKVIQVPIEVPEPDGNDLLRVLEAEMDKLRADFPKVGFSIEHWVKIFWFCIVPFVDSLRDVNRLCNMLRFKLGAIAPEVNLADLAAITLLEMKHPKVYEWVRGNKGLFVDDDDFKLDVEAAPSSIFDHPKSTPSSLREKGFQQIFTKIREEEKDEANVEKILQALAALFPLFAPWAEKQATSQLSRVNRYEYELLSGNHIGHLRKFNRYFSLKIRNAGFRTSDVLYFLEKMPEVDIPAALLEMRGKDYSGFLLEVEARIDQLTAERAKHLICAFFSTIPQLGEDYRAQTKAIKMLFPLLERIPEAERTSFFAEFIHSATKDTMFIVARTMHIMRDTLMKRGNEDGWDTNGLKEALLQRMEQLSDDESFFRMEHFRMVLSAWKELDSERCKARLNELLADEANVLRYLRRYVSPFSLGYEVDDEYTKYYPIEKVLDAIRHWREDGRFFSLIHDEQERCAALYLRDSEPQKYQVYCPRSDVTSLLAQWRAEYDSAQQKT